MFKRRVPPRTIFIISLILAIFFGMWFMQSLQNSQLWAKIISAIFTVWFGIDSYRAYTWWQAAEEEERKQQELEGVERK